MVGNVIMCLFYWLVMCLSFFAKHLSCFADLQISELQLFVYLRAEPSRIPFFHPTWGLSHVMYLSCVCFAHPIRYI